MKFKEWVKLRSTCSKYPRVTICNQIKSKMFRNMILRPILHLLLLRKQVQVAPFTCSFQLHKILKRHPSCSKIYF